jgi:hypothetical protein
MCREDSSCLERNASQCVNDRLAQEAIKSTTKSSKTASHAQPFFHTTHRSRAAAPKNATMNECCTAKLTMVWNEHGRFCVVVLHTTSGRGVILRKSGGFSGVAPSSANEAVGVEEREDAPEWRRLPPLGALRGVVGAARMTAAASQNRKGSEKVPTRRDARRRSALPAHWQCCRVQWPAEPGGRSDPARREYSGSPRSLIIHEPSAVGTEGSPAR